jgi:hypothetical protein
VHLSQDTSLLIVENEFKRCSPILDRSLSLKCTFATILLALVLKDKVLAAFPNHGRFSDPISSTLRNLMTYEDQAVDLLNMCGVEEMRTTALKSEKHSVEYLTLPSAAFENACHSLDDL